MSSQFIMFFGRRGNFKMVDGWNVQHLRLLDSLLNYRSFLLSSMGSGRYVQKSTLQKTSISRIIKNGKNMDFSHCKCNIYWSLIFIRLALCNCGNFISRSWIDRIWIRCGFCGDIQLLNMVLVHKLIYFFL